MRSFWVIWIGALAMLGCGNNGGENPTSSCLREPDGGTNDVNPSSPVVTNVAWDALGFCQQDARNNFNIFVFAEDPDSPLLELTFDLDVPSCTRVASDYNLFVLSCPNDGPATGVACAEDPDGNFSSRVGFTFQVCETGSCTQSPDACDPLLVDPEPPSGGGSSLAK
jgi:hypothetical protein